MNKRIQKKLEKRVEQVHIDELSESPWGRIRLAVEQFGDAFEQLVSTLRAELGTLREDGEAQLRGVVGAVDREVVPTLSRLPVVGPSVSRSVHQLVAHFG
jgi:hypothetical protein